MMFSQMTNDDLMVKFHECVRSERKIAHHVLEYIAEIETRQLYLGWSEPL
jgi:predicted PP-loop superfamily ATPase